MELTIDERDGFRGIAFTKQVSIHNKPSNMIPKMIIPIASYSGKHHTKNNNAHHHHIKKKNNRIKEA